MAEDLRLIEKNKPSEVDEFFAELKESEEFKQVLEKAKGSLQKGQTLKEALTKELLKEEKTLAEKVKEMKANEVADILDLALQELRGRKKTEEDQLSHDPQVFEALNTVYESLRHKTMPEEEPKPKEKPNPSQKMSECNCKETLSSIEKLTKELEELKNTGTKKAREDLGVEPEEKPTFVFNKDGTISEAW